MKLNRLLAKHQSFGRRWAREQVLAGRVCVNGTLCRNEFLEVTRFDRVKWDGTLIQGGTPAVYIMLHKPAGYVSATTDREHPTVLDLIQHPAREELHVAGRLDRFSTGLLLLTNDGAWSKGVTEPAFKLAKTYQVATDTAIPLDAVAAFERGFYFHTEDLTTQPARLEILGETEARVTLWEGRYHQIKRMFHRVGCRVRSLHRESVGGLSLDPGLAPGQWRELSPGEVKACTHASSSPAPGDPSRRG